MKYHHLDFGHLIAFSPVKHFKIIVSWRKIPHRWNADHFFLPAYCCFEQDRLHIKLPTANKFWNCISQLKNSVRCGNYILVHSEFCTFLTNPIVSRSQPQAGLTNPKSSKFLSSFASLHYMVDFIMIHVKSTQRR